MYTNYYSPTGTPAATYQQIRAFGLKGRPVSSIDEARASAVDFDGTVFYFPDLANKKIYTKQINLDGTATLLMYELVEVPEVEVPSYITREEFEHTVAELKALVAPAPPVAPLSEQPQTPKQEFKF